MKVRKAHRFQYGRYLTMKKFYIHRISRDGAIYLENFYNEDDIIWIGGHWEGIVAETMAKAFAAEANHLTAYRYIEIYNRLVGGYDKAA